MALASWQGALLVGGCVMLPVAQLSGMLWLSGGPGVAKSMGGVPASAHITNLARRAAEAVGVPSPEHVFMIKAAEPNAFAAGLRRSDTTVAVTSGLVNALSENELMAVLAHEMAHLRHKDVGRNMHVAIAAAGLGGVYTAGRYLFESGQRASNAKKKDKDDDSTSSGLGLGLMALGMGAQGLAHITRLAASRSAELAADRAAAEAFGADALISALRKINSRAAQHSDLRQHSSAQSMAHAMISDGPTVAVAPAASKDSNGKGGWLSRQWGRLTRALRTHPPLDERVAALEAAVAQGAVPKRAVGSSASTWFG